MISKVEILSYYFSLGVDLYFISTLAPKIVNSPTNSDSDIGKAVLRGLDVMSLAVAITLLCLDFATLKIYYVKSTQSKTEDGNLNKLAFEYLVDTRVELLAIVFVTVFLASTRSGFTMPTSAAIDVSIAFGLMDFFLVAARSTARINAYLEDPEYDVFLMQYYDNLLPFSIIYFLCFSLYDVIQAFVLLPRTILWSIHALYAEPWLPDFVRQI